MEQQPDPRETPLSSGLPPLLGRLAFWPATRAHSAAISVRVRQGSVQLARECRTLKVWSIAPLRARQNAIADRRSRYFLATRPNPQWTMCPVTGQLAEATKTMWVSRNAKSHRRAFPRPECCASRRPSSPRRCHRPCQADAWQADQRWAREFTHRLAVGPSMSACLKCFSIGDDWVDNVALSVAVLKSSSARRHFEEVPNRFML